MRRAGGRRYYRPQDLDLLRGIRVLLYEQKYTTKGVQKIFKDEGAKFITDIGRRSGTGDVLELRTVVDDGDHEGNGGDDVLNLGPDHQIGQPAKSNPGPSPEFHAALTRMMERLETIQDALDDAALALEAIDAADGESDGDDDDADGDEPNA